MPTATDDTQPLSAFQRDAEQVAARLKRTGKPLVLTVDGKAEVVVQDAAAYRRMAELAARAGQAEMAAFLTASRAEMDAGNTIPAAAFVASLGSSPT
jgi:PHD/YefM family antitoxin component YafN of YafNO toxin-antitoxin module